jgi:hypothetical protein
VGEVMTRIGWTLADLATQLLEPHERDAVRGDLAECGASGWCALYEVLGLVLRRQGALWTEWRPWLALVGVVLPLGVLLSHASRAWADSSALNISLYIRIWEWSYLGYPGWRRDLFVILWSGALSATALSVWSWTCGYMLASVSRRTIWVGAIAFVLVVFLATLGTSTVARMTHDKFAGHFYGIVLPRLFRFAFVILPMLWGIQSRRKGVVGPTMLLVGAAAVIVLTVLVSPGLENSLVWGRGLYGDAGPDRTFGTGDDPRPLWPVAIVMLWPTAYILATAMPNRQRRLDA